MVSLRKKRYLTAISFTTLIFFLGVLIGSKITSMDIETIQESLQEDILEMQSLELELTLAKQVSNESLCNYVKYRLSDIIKSKVELAKKFDIGDIPPKQAELLRKQYTISLMRYLLFFETQERECNLKEPKILFFFDESETSREQGKVLDYIVYRLSENITVFSFNTAWDEPLIKLMIGTYNITETPSLIIKDNKYVNYQSKERITEILCKYYDLVIC